MRNLNNFLLYEYYSLQLGALHKYRLHKGGHQVRMDVKMGEGDLTLRMFTFDMVKNFGQILTGLFREFATL